nr:acyl-coenzyme A thioesterase 13-like [Ipomoea batatas]
MDLESVKRFLEGEEGNENESPVVDSMPSKFLEPLICHGLKIELVEPDRILCSFKVPQRLVNSDNILNGGVTAALVDVVGAAAVFVGGAPNTGVSVEINVSYVDVAYTGDEVEIEAKVLRIRGAIAVVSVELRNKKTGKVIAQGRHSKYLGRRSKL